MKRLLAALAVTFFLSVVAPSSVSAASNIRLWPHKHHKDASETTEPAKPKTKRSLLHRAKPSPEQAAQSEATFGTTGPQSVGWRHPQPGPAGFGAK
jgi:hypothetical protein